MLLTEKQAKTKWCPHVRIVTNRKIDDRHFINDEASYNRIVIDDLKGTAIVPKRVFTNCIASECMMWKWHNAIHTNGYCGLTGIAK